MVVAGKGEPEYFKSQFLPAFANSMLMRLPVLTKALQKLTVNRQTEAAIRILGEENVKAGRLIKAYIANHPTLFEDHILDKNIVELIGYPFREDESLDEELEFWLAEEKANRRSVVVINAGSLAQNPDQYALAIQEVATAREADTSFLIISPWEGVADMDFGDNVFVRREYVPLIQLLQSGYVDAMISNGGVGAMHISSTLGVPVGAFTSFADQVTMVGAVSDALNSRNIRSRREKKLVVPSMSAHDISSGTLDELISQLLSDELKERFLRLGDLLMETPPNHQALVDDLLNAVDEALNSAE